MTFQSTACLLVLIATASCGSGQIITVMNNSDADLVNIRFGSSDENEAVLVIDEVLAGESSGSKELSEDTYDTYFGLRDTDNTVYTSAKVEMKSCETQTITYSQDGSWTAECK